jgi:hypothetical protein
MRSRFDRWVKSTGFPPSVTADTAMPFPPAADVRSRNASVTPAASFSETVVWPEMSSLASPSARRNT